MRNAIEILQKCAHNDVIPLITDVNVIGSVLLIKPCLNIKSQSLFILLNAVRYNHLAFKICQFNCQVNHRIEAFFCFIRYCSITFKIIKDWYLLIWLLKIILNNDLLLKVLFVLNVKCDVIHISKVKCFYHHRHCHFVCIGDESFTAQIRDLKLINTWQIEHMVRELSKVKGNFYFLNLVRIDK